MVAPFAGAWIEIEEPAQPWHCAAVAPFAGAWIEIGRRSLVWFFHSVAPFAGAWIEMLKDGMKPEDARVAPFAGAWIEMLKEDKVNKPEESLPSRERGLKSECYKIYFVSRSRSLRGSVD